MERGRRLRGCLADEEEEDGRVGETEEEGRDEEGEEEEGLVFDVERSIATSDAAAE